MYLIEKLPIINQYQFTYMSFILMTILTYFLNY